MATLKLESKEVQYKHVYHVGVTESDILQMYTDLVSESNDVKNRFVPLVTKLLAMKNELQVLLTYQEDNLASMVVFVVSLYGVKVLYQNWKSKRITRLVTDELRSKFHSNVSIDINYQNQNEIVLLTKFGYDTSSITITPKWGEQK